MADYAERKRLEKEAYHQNEKQRLKNSVRKESNASSKTYDGNPRPSSSNGQLNEKQPTHSFIGDDSILTPSPASKDNSKIFSTTTYKLWSGFNIKQVQKLKLDTAW